MDVSWLYFFDGGGGGGGQRRLPPLLREILQTYTQYTHSMTLSVLFGPDLNFTFEKLQVQVVFLTLFEDFHPD